MNHEEVKQRLDALFVGDALEAPLRVRVHLKDCLRCRSYFEELVRVERALGEGIDDEPSFEQRYTDAVVAAAISDQSPAREKGLVASLRETLGRLSLRTLVPVAVAIAMVAGVSVAVVQSLEEEQADDGFAPRVGVVEPMGDAMPPRAGVHRVEIFCVERGEEGIKINEASGDALECGLGDEIKFAFVNAPVRGEQALPWLTLVGLDEAGEVRWYHPVDPGAGGIASMKVGASSRIKLLGETIRLEVNHKAGSVDLHAIFSASPLPREAVSSRLRLGERAPDFVGLSLRDQKGQSVTLGARGSGEYVTTSHVLKIVARAAGSPRGESP